MDARNLERLNAARLSRSAVIQVTDLDEATDRIIIEGETVEAELADAVAGRFRSGRSGIAEVDGKRLFLNVHLPPPHIVIIGAVHISQVLAQMAALAGFDVRIIDPRTAFATPERFSSVDLVADWPVDVLSDNPLDAYTALVAVTHDPKIDDFPIGEALRAGCFYIGALGSRKTHAARLERLKAEGFEEAALDAIHAPIGLNIGAASPAEIAVAILAEIIATLRSRNISSPKADMR
jgi:xanthine dehydrogenase accessory factor